MMTREERKKAILKRRIFLTACISVAVLIIVLIIVGISSFFGKDNGKDSSSKADVSSSSESSSAESSSSEASSEAETSSEAVSSTVAPAVSVPATPVPVNLDPNYTNLLLVNAWKPLPSNYNYGAGLVTMPDSYINGSLKQVKSDMWPYLKALVDQARKDGVWIAVVSPYRSYDIQNMLFRNQVNRAISNGTPKEKAEAVAATIVARPGTSEHNTGLAVDFNMADDRFTNTPMFKWLLEHGEDYGFIYRYQAKKQSITGIIPESWHWRFVGINTAKEMNKLDMCLEEYVEYLEKKNKEDKKETNSSKEVTSSKETTSSKESTSSEVSVSSKEITSSEETE